MVLSINKYTSTIFYAKNTRILFLVEHYRIKADIIKF